DVSYDQVIGAAEAQVGRAGEQVHGGKLVSDHRHAAVGRAIVHDPGLELGRLRPGQRRQTLCQKVASVPADDDDRDAAHAPRAPPLGAVAAAGATPAAGLAAASARAICSSATSPPRKSQPSTLARKPLMPTL